MFFGLFRIPGSFFFVLFILGFVVGTYVGLESKGCSLTADPPPPLLHSIPPGVPR